MNGESLPALVAILFLVIILILVLVIARQRDRGFFENLAFLSNRIFFPPPLSDSVSFKSEQNPVWARSAEQALTSIIRLAALLALLSFPFLISYRRAFSFYTVVSASLLILIWVVAVRRSLNFRLRLLVLSLAIYAFACVEIFYSGRSSETFIYFFFLIILTALLGNAFDILATLAVLSLTILGAEWLITEGIHVPPAGMLNFFYETSILFSLLIFNMASLTVVLPISAVKRSLETSWQREVDSRNLLEEERNLLEQHVAKRTNELAFSEAKHRKLVEQLPVVVYQEDLIQPHTKQYISPQAELLLGYPMKELSKNPNHWISIVHPDDHEIIAAALETLEKTGHSDTEYRVITNDRRVIWLSDRASIIHDKEGEPQFVQGVLTDITVNRMVTQELRRLNAELEQRVISRTAELQSANEYLQSMLSTSLAVSSSLDPDEVLDHVILWARSLVRCRTINIMLIQSEFAVIARRIGVEENGGVERNLADLKFPLTWISFATMLETGKSVYIEDTKLFPDWQHAESSEWVRSYVGIPLRMGGETLGFLNASHNTPGFFSKNELSILEGLTEQAAIAIHNSRLLMNLQKSLQQEKVMRNHLVQSDKLAALGKMVAVIAHEINNPIQTVRNSLFLIHDQIKMDSQLSTVFEIAQSETSRLADLVAQLRDTYRPGSKVFTRLNLQTLLDEIAIILTPQLRKSQVEWSQADTGNNYEIMGVRNDLKQVLINITLNAMDAMPTGGIITVSFEQRREIHQVGVSLHNTGPLIPEDVLPNIFDPFFTTKEGEGTGLGLAISYEIVHQHYGEISVVSSPERGVVFTIWLPLAVNSEFQIEERPSL